MKNFLYTLLVFLVSPSFLSACSCDGHKFFCEATSENSLVVRGEILNQYQVGENAYMDVMVLETILGELTVNTLTIVNQNFLTCELSHSTFEVGDEVILNNIDETRIDDISGNPSVSPGGCTTSLLRLNDGIVTGGIQPDLNSQSLEEFKSNIGACSELTDIDRRISQLDNRLTIFPNPSSDDIFVDLTIRLEETASFELFNAVGQRIQEGLLNLNEQSKIQIKYFSEGVYFLKIKVRDEIITMRILKN